MPAITLKGATGDVKTRREGSNVIVEKTIDKAVLVETHKAGGKRVTGKQTPGKPVTLTAADLKGFENDTQTRIKEAVKVGKEENKKAILWLNEQANQYGATLEKKLEAETKKHKAETKKTAARMKLLTNTVVKTKQANKKMTKNPEIENVKTGMNAFANDMLKKVSEEHQAELKKAVDKKTEYMKSTRRLRQERNEYKAEATRLKESLDGLIEGTARSRPPPPAMPTAQLMPKASAPPPARVRSSNSSA
jgi:hypothetical protein